MVDRKISDRLTITDEGKAIFTYAVREVTLVIKTPVDQTPPSEWNWPFILEVEEDDVEVISEKYIGEATFVCGGE